MKLKTTALLAAAAVLAAACSPAPGSAEWCEGIQKGSVQPTAQEAMEHGEKCLEHGLKSLGL